MDISADLALRTQQDKKLSQLSSTVRCRIHCEIWRCIFKCVKISAELTFRTQWDGRVSLERTGEVSLHALRSGQTSCLQHSKTLKRSELLASPQLPQKMGRNFFTCVRISPDLALPTQPSKIWRSIFTCAKLLRSAQTSRFEHSGAGEPPLKDLEKYLYMC